MIYFFTLQGRNIFCLWKCYKCLWSWELDMVEVQAEELCDYCHEPYMGCLHSTAWTCGLIKCLTNPAKIQTLYNSTNISCWSFADNLYVRCCEYFSEQKKPFAWFYFSASSLTFMLKEAVPIQDFSSLGLLISWFSSFKFQRHRRGMEIAQVCSLAGFVKVTNALWCCFPTWLHKLALVFLRERWWEFLWIIFDLKHWF